ncbi:MAG: ABC transporter ATP-binding protein [Oscillospiraceae bacterium]|nr:ABC transporter ATP-binding protein [Oscillospiraceae bacterium]
MGNSKLLVLNDLSVWYTRGKPVLDKFSMELGTNEVVGLIGLNGAGKTTFIKTLSGLLDNFRIEAALWQDMPFKFRDRDFKKDRYTAFAEDHSFQFFTFREYASYVAASYGKKLTDIDELVRGFHFEEYTDILLKELSTGNLKKAYLITAFALKPKLLMLDEPVNGLDFQSTEYLYRQINNYRQHGTILFSSHILESICLTSDRVLVLEQGQIKRSFTGREIETAKIREVLKE